MAMALDLLANRNTETERSLHLSHSHSHSHNHRDRDRDRDRDRVLLDLYGDVLEAVVSRVPSADLIPASRVSREWRRAVRSSLLRLPRRSPWLLLRFLPRPSSPALYSLHAFDPFSSSWLSLPLPHTSTCTTDAVTVTSFLSASSGDRLHTLSASALSVSQDPFATHWRKEAKAPKMWRKDAVVAEVDRWVVVAGGGCPMVLEEGEVVGAVEVYDKQAGAWASAEPIPPQFDGSAYATWLSAAASDQRLYVMEKKTALVAWFDPQSKAWGPTCQLRLDPAVSAWAIAIGRDERLVAVGVGPVGQSGTKVRFWELNRDTLQPVVADPKTKTKTKTKMEEEMPTEMVQRLFPFEEGDDDTWRCCSVEVCGTDRGGYVYNPSEMRNGAVLYEFTENERGSIVGRWEWVPLPERVADCGVGRMEFGCSAVALDDLASFSRHST